MKMLLPVLLLTFSFSSMAVSVVTKVPAFSGKLVAVTPGLDITSLKVEVENHFCSISTCAGGPSEMKDVNAEIVSNAEGSLLQFSSLKSITHSSRKLFGNFSSCSIKLTATGRTENGTPVTGTHRVGFSFNAKDCGNIALMGEKILKELASPINVTVQEGYPVSLRMRSAE